MTSSRQYTCAECKRDIQYIGVGRLPTLCADCRSLPDVLRRKAKEASDRKKARAKERVDKLMEKMSGQLPDS